MSFVGQSASRFTETFKVTPSSTNMSYRAVFQDTDNSVDFASAGSHHAIGILEEENAVAASPLRVCTFGITKAVCYETVYRGSWCTHGASGSVLHAKTGLTSVIGQARQNGVAGQVISFFVNPQPNTIASGVASGGAANP